MEYRSNCCWAEVSVLGTCTNCLTENCVKTLTTQDGRIYVSDKDCVVGKEIAKGLV